MPFRDDEEARLARLTSLEHENEDLRAELDEARRENARLAATGASEPAPARPAPAPRPDPSAHRGPAPAGPRVRWLAHARTGLVTAAVVAAAVVVVRCAACSLRDRRIAEIAYVEGVLSVKVTSTTRTRSSRSTATELVSLDLATGERTGAVELPAGELQFPAHGTRAWLRLGGGKLALVDVAVPKIVLRHDQLAARVPELAGGFALGDTGQGLSTVGDGAVVDHETRTPDAVPIVLADGSRAWLDPEPRLVRAPPRAAVANPVGYACLAYDAPSCERRHCFAWVSSDGATTRRLGGSPGWRGVQEQPPLAGPAAVPLHAPAFVKRLDRRCAIEIDGGVLVRHESSALAPHHRLLSLTHADGTLRWTRRVDELAGDDAMPVGGIVAGDRIYLLLGDAWGRESLAIRWFSSTRLVLVHLATSTGETLAKHTLW